MKIVINCCYGGFGLSDKAIELGKQLSNNPNWGEYDPERNDPILVKVVETLGEEANCRFASLQIEEIPKGTKYRIRQYDGYESLETIDNIPWQEAD